MTKKITIQLPKGFLEILDQYTDKGTSQKDIRQLLMTFIDDQLTKQEINHQEGFGVEEQVTFLIFKAYLAGLDKGKSFVANKQASESKTELPDECKVANKEHCFLSGKCKQCEFTVPQ